MMGLCGSNISLLYFDDDKCECDAQFHKVLQVEKGLTCLFLAYI